MLLVAWGKTSDVVEDISLDDVSIYDFIPFPAARDDVKCGECGRAMVVRANKDGRPFYGCFYFPECRGTHGAHPDGRPLGIPADKATRKARIEAHRYFDMLWQPQDGQKARMTRPKAYAWMRKMMSLTETEAHFGKFNLAQCERLIRVVKHNFPGVRSLWDRLGDDDFG